MRLEQEMKTILPRATVASVILLMLFTLDACGGGGGGSSPPTTYTVGGTVSGLVGTGLVLQDNGNGNLTVPASGSFTFSTALASGSAYSVTVQTQPTNPSQTCVVTNGSGTLGGNVASVTVTCTTNTYSVGGSVSGLTGAGLSLRNNASDNLAVATNGAFAFNTPVASGASYAVTIGSQPAGETCSVSNGSGAVSSTAITSVSVACVPLTNVWTWVSGSSVGKTSGVYGTQGSPSGGTVPGARFAGSSWTDPAGDLWLFGGQGYDSAGGIGALNDLWKFTPTSGTWTWTSGSKVWGASTNVSLPASNDVPGARLGASSWTDSAGSLWLFGGDGYDSNAANGLLSDLWKYTPSSGLWIFLGSTTLVGTGGAYGTQGMTAAGNFPGARQDASSWTDSTGSLWLFGGYGYGSTGTQGSLNDLWKYDPNSGTWTWESGANVVGANGVYGTQGVGSTSNVPGARVGATSWTDAAGNLWLFGGVGQGPNPTGSVAGYLNDLWKYTPNTGTWTWISGSTAWNAGGVYGTQGSPSIANVPGARQYAISWTDPAGDLWLFGGQGYDSAGAYNRLNDLWKFSPAAGTWTWIGGNNVGGAPGAYGTLGVPSPNNVPGARFSPSSWLDPSGNLWLFGGEGLDSIGDSVLNDLWKFSP
jgi:N-acetylneuraminic acid mutarotase